MSERSEFLEKVYQRGFNYEKANHGCGQCTVGALQDFFEIDDQIFKSASAFAGGIASVTSGYCGAFNGGLLVLNYFFGRDRADFSKQEAMEKAKEMAYVFRDRFADKFEGFTCGQVQTKIFGRSFNTADPEEKEKFVEAGAYEDKCTNVVGTSAALVAEILMENGINPR